MKKPIPQSFQFFLLPLSVSISGGLAISFLFFEAFSHDPIPSQVTFWAYRIGLMVITILWMIYIYRLWIQKRRAEDMALEAADKFSEEERRLETTFSSIGDALITTDANGKIIRMNTVAVKMTGWSEQDAIGRPLEEVFNLVTGSHEKIRYLTERVLKGNQTTDLNEQKILISCHGEETPIEDNATIIVGKGGKEIGVLLVFRDVTERRRALQSLADNERKFRLFFENMAEGVAIHRMIYDLHGVPLNYVIVDVNPRYEQIIGLPRDMVIGRLATDVYRVAEPPYLSQYSDVVRTGKACSFEMYFQPMGRYFSVSAISYSPQVFATVFTDVSAEKKAETALRESEERFRRLFELPLVGVAIASPDGRWLMVNDKFCSMVGYRREELHELTWKDLTPLEDLPSEMARNDRILAGEKDPAPFEKTYIHKDGHVVRTLLSSMCVRDAKGQVEHMVSFLQDITEQKDVEGRLKMALEATNDGLWDWYIKGRMYFGPRYYAMLGYEPDEFEPSYEVWKNLVLPEDLPRCEEFIQRYLAGEEDSFNIEYRMHTKAGEWRWFQVRGKAVERDTQGNIQRIVGTITDISEKKDTEHMLAQERNLLRTLIDNLPDSIYLKDVGGRKILANRADLEMMGVEDERDILGKTDADFYPRHLAEQYVRDDQIVLRGRAVINREEIIENLSGLSRWLLTSKIPLKNEAGDITGLIGIGRDITDRKLLESKLLAMAHYDPLTALPNRSLFLEKANTGLAQARRHGGKCAVLFIDLDHFKSVNDTMGHSVGDELLKDSAVRLAECVRESDTMARLGGDEFIIFLNDIEEGERVQQIAERIREKLNSSRMIAGNDLFITASMGIAVYPTDGESLEDLLKNADTAMYAAKETGRNAYCFFDRIMNQRAVTKMQVERGLREALDRKELALFYQPIIEVGTGKIRGFEALLRWFRNEGGLVFPDEFIPIAEETGLIIPIGEWVVHQACRFNKSLLDAGYGKFIMAVNISVAQLRRKNMVEIIASALKETGLPPECLEIEITESILIDSFDGAINLLKEIRALGVKISLDDFGTGYSSLSHLQKLPISHLKIDRLFIKEIINESEENDLTPAIIELAHKLRLGVVAEGVETDLQLERLARNRCDFFQGYLFSKPIPEQNVVPFLLENPSRLH